MVNPLARARRQWLQRAALWGTAALGFDALAGLPEVISAVRPSVLPLGLFDPLASPRFAFRGTAFVVGDGRHVVTNHHVVSGVTSPRFALRLPQSESSGSWLMAELVGQDREHDLALLRFDGTPLPALKLAPSDTVREGQAVALIGFPIAGLLGFQPVTHRGIVSSIAAITLPAANAARLVDSAIALLRRGSFDIYQLDATAYPGNSGGPVLDADSGEVVAVVNMVLAKGGREAALQHPTGISYAIPVRHVRDLVDKHLR